MTIKVGDKIPEGTLTQMTEKGPAPISTSELFGGKKVVLFAVPGAFTPTCSAKHLPSFVENRQSLTDKGIDEVCATAVNDPFVMRAWGQQSSAEGITMLADGNGELVEALGLSESS